MAGGATRLLWTAGNGALATPPTNVEAPNRTRTEFFGSPPRAFSLAAKKGGISLPVTILAPLARAMLTVFVFGVASTEKSGLAQLPAFGAEVWRSPT